MSATPMSWHLDEPLARRYAGDDLDPATAASVEAHLLGCAGCRASLAAALPAAARVDAIWTEVVDRLDRPRGRLLERVLCRLGLREGEARLLAATPSLQLSWLAAVLLALGFAVAAAHGADDAGAIFLLIAPLLPVAGVAAAYGPDIDPAHELTIAAPYRATRLLLLRSVSVLAGSLAVSAVAAFALPATGWAQVAWLLPSLGLTVTTLALSTRLAPSVSAGLVAGTWAVVVIRLAQLRQTGALAGGESQLIFLSLIVAAAVVVVVRRDQFDTRSST